MRVFRLDPLPAKLTDRKWGSTFIRTKCWVRAEDEDQARSLVAQWTQKATVAADRRPLAPPWDDPDLVSCQADASVDVREGVIVTSEGTRIPLAVPSMKSALRSFGRPEGALTTPKV